MRRFIVLLLLGCAPPIAVERACAEHELLFLLKKSSGELGDCAIAPPCPWTEDVPEPVLDDCLERLDPVTDCYTFHEISINECGG